MSLLTVSAPATSQFKDRGSRFIGHLVPWSDFHSKLSNLREQHRKASHHVTAFRRMLPDNRIEESAKDDGEPAGTSGMPTLKVLIGANLVDAGIIVVRYFGGTKLGAGGLARAYAGTALRTIETATIVPWHRIVSRTVSCPFENMSVMEQRIAAAGLSVINRTYNNTGVIISVEGPEETIASVVEDS